QINNIYFDTPNLQAFADNVAGVADRKKYRVRWYGQVEEYVERPKLELKAKRNQLGFKKTTSIQPFSAKELPQMVAEVNQLIPDLPSLRPTLVNAYQRSYFATADQKFRITIDTDLAFGHCNEQFLHLPFRDFETTIIELKYDASFELELDRITQYLPFRLTKSSKYVYGVNRLYY
ncbi:MAG: polyphosphate polymerase domain-containing protein, partial [Bacteroidota bacterium]